MDTNLPPQEKLQCDPILLLKTEVLNWGVVPPLGVGWGTKPDGSVVMAVVGGGATAVLCGSPCHLGKICCPLLLPSLPKAGAGERALSVSCSSTDCLPFPRRQESGEGRGSILPARAEIYERTGDSNVIVILAPVPAGLLALTEKNKSLQHWLMLLVFSQLHFPQALLRGQLSLVQMGPRHL